MKERLIVGELSVPDALEPDPEEASLLSLNLFVEGENCDGIRGDGQPD